MSLFNTGGTLYQSIYRGSFSLGPFPPFHRLPKHKEERRKLAASLPLGTRHWIRSWIRSAVRRSGDPYTCARGPQRLMRPGRALSSPHALTWRLYLILQVASSSHPTAMPTAPPRSASYPPPVASPGFRRTTPQVPPRTRAPPPFPFLSRRRVSRTTAGDGIVVV